MGQDNKNNEGIDLSGALKNSGRNSGDENLPSGAHPWDPKMIQWVIKYSGGLIKNKKQAFCVLLGFIVLAVIISIFLIFGGSGVRKTPEETFIPPAEEHIPIYP